MRTSDVSETPSTARLFNPQVWLSPESPNVKRRLYLGTPVTPQAEDCVLCLRRVLPADMPRIVQSALYKKYSTETRFHYTRDINKLVEDEHSTVVLQFQEAVMYAKPKECLSRYYKDAEFDRKFELLWKFHQFAKVRPGMFGKETFAIIYRNHFEKRRVHERAIRKMLDRLSNSQLQAADVNLERFMKDSIVFEDDKRASLSRVIDEEAVQPLRLIAGSDLKSALMGAIKSQADKAAEPRGKTSYLLQASGDETKQLFEGMAHAERIGDPSFLQGHDKQKSINRSRGEIKPCDLSAHFKKSGCDESQVINKPFSGNYQTHEASNEPLISKKLVCKPDIPRPDQPAKKKMPTIESDDKENVQPNISLNDATKLKDKMGDENTTEAIRALGKPKWISKNSTAIQSKQSKLSGLFSTRDEEGKTKTSINGSREKEPTMKTSRHLKIAVSDHDRFDLQLLKSSQVTMRTKNLLNDQASQVTTGLSRKKLPKGGIVKRKFNIADIDRFLRAQMQTPMEAQQRQLSKDRRFDSAISQERKKLADSKDKRSISKEQGKGYFVARAYRAGSRGSGGGHSGSAQNSRAQSKERGLNRLAQTTSQIRLPPGLMASDPKMKTMGFLESRSFAQCKAPASFMSTRRLFEDKADSKGKDSVRVSKIISPKGRDLLERIGMSTGRLASRGPPGKQEIFESLRRGRRSSANKSGFNDTTKQSIKPPPKQKTKREKRQPKNGSVSKKEHASSRQNNSRSRQFAACTSSVAYQNDESRRLSKTSKSITKLLIKK